MAVKKREEIRREAIEWYAKNINIYGALCQKVETIIKDILEAEGISIHTTTCRPKEIDSFYKKIEDPKYTNPQDQIKDLAGIRIIAYVESDLERINKIIEDTFDIDPAHSLDKADELGIDKVGYKSVHHVGTLKKERTELPDFKKFKGLFFEIQVRTILQHAWAEIEHDKNYKFSGKLDDKIKRRFKILAGLLELADREFDSLANEIDKIIVQVENATKAGELDIEINTTTLKSYLSTKFAKSIENGDLHPHFSNSEYENKIIQELESYGLKTLQDIENIIPENYEKKRLELLKEEDNFLGLTRDLMIIHDYNKYFTKSWTKDFTGLGESGRKLYPYYNLSVDEITDSYDVSSY